VIRRLNALPPTLVRRYDPIPPLRRVKAAYLRAPSQGIGTTLQPHCQRGGRPRRLDVIPAQFRVIETHPAPRLIKGGLPTEAMVAIRLASATLSTSSTSGSADRGISSELRSFWRKMQLTSPLSPRPGRAAIYAGCDQACLRLKGAEFTEEDQPRSAVAPNPRNYPPMSTRAAIQPRKPRA
jgi:hypothetical protein